MPFLPSPSPADRIPPPLPRYLPLAGPLLVYLLLSLWAQPAFLSSDDNVYAILANNILTGGDRYAEGYVVHRVGGYWPAVPFFALLGITPWSMVLWPWLCGAALVGVLFHLVRNSFGLQAGFWAALLLAANPLFLKWALHLMNDVPISLLTLLGVAVAWWARQPDRQGAAFRYALAGTAVFYAGWLTKESIIWILPFLTLLMAADLSRGEHRAFWGWAVALLIGGGLLYLGWQWLLYGDPLIRFRAVSTLGLGADQWGYSDKSLIHLAKRLTYQPVVMFLRDEGFTTAAVLTVAALSPWHPPGDANPAAHRYWSLALWGILLAYWFGSRSYHTYNPTFTVIRLWLPILPFLCIAAAVALSRLFRDKGGESGPPWVALWPPAGVAAAAAMSRHLAFPTFHLEALALPLGLALFSRLPLPFPPWWRRHWPKAGIALMAAAVVSVPAHLIHDEKLGAYHFQKGERELINAHLKPERAPSLVVVADLQSIDTVAHYFEYRLPPHLTVEEWNAFPHTLPPDKEKVYLFIKKQRLGRHHPRLAWIEEAHREGWTPLGNRGGVYLFVKERSPGPPTPGNPLRPTVSGSPP